MGRMNWLAGVAGATYPVQTVGTLPLCKALMRKEVSASALGILYVGFVLLLCKMLLLCDAGL